MLHLQKTLYGLKQSRCHWYWKLTSIFTSLGFTLCSVNQAIFFKFYPHTKELTIIMVHVDDCTIAATSLHLVDDLKAGLHWQVKVMDLGALHWVLGIQVKHNCDAWTIHLSQHAYLESIICCYGFEGLKPLSTPMDAQLHLHSDQAPSSMAKLMAMHNVPYCKAMGALNWAALALKGI
jgi:hypothetical protein